MLFSNLYFSTIAHRWKDIDILLWFYQKIKINFRWTLHRGLYNFVLKILYLIQLFLSIKYQDIQVSCKTSNKDKICIVEKTQTIFAWDTRCETSRWWMKDISTGFQGFSSNWKKSYKWNKKITELTARKYKQHRRNAWYVWKDWKPERSIDWFKYMYAKRMMRARELLLYEFGSVLTLYVHWTLGLNETSLWNEFETIFTESKCHQKKYLSINWKYWTLLG